MGPINNTGSNSCSYIYNVTLSTLRDLDFGGIRCTVRSHPQLSSSCDSEKDLSIKVQPPYPAIIKETKDSQTETYICNISCKYSPSNWYDETDHALDPINLSHNCNDDRESFLNITLLINRTEELPMSIKCGGMWDETWYYSKLINRSRIPTTTADTAYTTGSMTPGEDKFSILWCYL